MVYVLHKFHHMQLDGWQITSYVDHMALLYLVWKPQVLRIIVRWLLLFLKYDFLVTYKLGKSHFMTNALSQMFDFIEENGVLDQTTNVTFFLLQLVWI
jgi:hypothetical protein